jgi:peptidoglycan/LPS O-acetylase OafA/YrhL
MDSLMAGSLLCQLHRNASTIPRSWVLAGIAALLALIVLSFIISGNVDFSNPFFGTVGYTVLAALFAGILHLAVQPGKSRLKAFLSVGFLRFCGRISYCLYLIHMPIIIIIGSWISINGARRWPEHALLARWTALSVSIVLSFGLSALSYRYFEPIFQRLKRDPATSSGTSSHTRY